MIRLLTVKELPILLEGGREFFAEGKIPGGFDEAHFLKMFSGLMADGIARVAGSFDNKSDGGDIHGALGWMLSPGLFSPSLIATEAFWYMKAEHRGRIGEGIHLLSFFEASAVAQGAKFLALIHLMNLQPEKLSVLYVRRGYTLVENHFVKEVLN